MHKSEDPIICPVAPLKHILRAREEVADDSIFLCGETTSADVATALKATATSAGVSAANYSTHSIRIGGATALLTGEASRLSIKLLGRWLSNCFEHYPVQAVEARGCCLRSLSLPISKIELDTLVLDVLWFIGGDLRKLSMLIDESNPDEVHDPNNRADLDLGRLAVVCPKLERIKLSCFDVVVLPTHDDALRDWPIQKIDIKYSATLSTLAPYLQNPSMRMSRDLVELNVEASSNVDFDEEDKGKTLADDVDYPPLVKENFSLQCKKAVISIMNSSEKSKAVRRLDANVLSIIFKLTATPMRRQVRCH
ncbi:hypothetical protein F443_02479 [Phytophthora nicotianae P1569]|uniref:Tyr recombinase domain-containing protein n=1 Tax=Phytophthora nicotianae P1569 TaxID=1317065 RepID=V9FTE7_PHYNI|nr:hypothetical protein F443_02479 [Phytophthora nicotianae P1569]